MVVQLGGWVVVRLVALVLIEVVMVLEVLVGVVLSQSSTAFIRGSVQFKTTPLLSIFFKLGVRTGPVCSIGVDVKLVWWRWWCFLHV
ncbi:MAG: hypothetical protein ACRCVL_07700 [Cetobacterium sp.]